MSNSYAVQADASSTYTLISRAMQLTEFQQMSFLHVPFLNTLFSGIQP